jgi:hypothetical protein
MTVTYFFYTQGIISFLTGFGTALINQMNNWIQILLQSLRNFIALEKSCKSSGPFICVMKGHMNEVLFYIPNDVITNSFYCIVSF